jgi:Tol biopolymer transport system component
METWIMFRVRTGISDNSTQVMPKGRKITQCVTLLIFTMLFLATGTKNVNADYYFDTPVNLGPNINSQYGDAVPSISSDGLTLLFESDRPSGFGGCDIWVTTRATKDDEWVGPVNLGSTVNSSYYDGEPSVSADGLSLFFVSNRPGGSGDYDLWVTTRTSIAEPWGEPTNLGTTVNSSTEDATPSISPDGLSLFFHSTRSGGYGAVDIWVTKRATLDDPWQEPVNLGPAVNTLDIEATPGISADMLTLFFASIRPGGYGYSDIWMTSRATVDDPWEPPVNLGAVVNSSYREGGPNISMDGSTLYFNSMRPGGYGDWDLWQVSINPKPTCGDEDHPYPIGDLNQDCRVDWFDVAIIFSHWLEDNNP